MKTNSSWISFWLTLLAVVVLVVWGQSQALGQPRTSTYSVQHVYSWQPANPNPAFQVSWAHFEHAWAHDVALGWSSSVNPVPQGPGFNNLGTDRLDAAGQAWNTGLTGLVPIIEASAVLTGVIPPAGGNSSANAVMGGANAIATSSWTINNLTNGLWATNTSNGQATTTGSHANEAYAFSESKLVIVDQPQGAPTGIVSWQPRWSDTGAGSAHAYDPVHVTLFDDFGVVALEDTPIHIEGSLLQGETDESRLGWEDGRLFAEGVWEGSICGVVEGPYIDPADAGEFEVRVHHGVVTTSRHTGVFNTALLPPVGAPGTFDVAFLNQIDINYAYPSLAPNMSLAFGGGGGGAVPEPGTFALLAASGLGLLVYVVRSRKPRIGLLGRGR
jgi:hypothetical protein